MASIARPYVNLPETFVTKRNGPKLQRNAYIFGSAAMKKVLGQGAPQQSCGEGFSGGSSEAAPHGESTNQGTGGLQRTPAEIA